MLVAATCSCLAWLGLALGCRSTSKSEEFSFGHQGSRNYKELQWCENDDLAVKKKLPSGRGCYGDFETLNTQIIDCTTTQNMCLGCPKRPRSSRNSKVDRRSARTKAVQNVRSARSPWHVVARALTRACKLSSTSQSAGESTLKPGHGSRTALTNSMRMPDTHCHSRPNSPCAHKNDKGCKAAQRAAHGFCHDP